MILADYEIGMAIMDGEFPFTLDCLPVTLNEEGVEDVED